MDRDKTMAELIKALRKVRRAYPSTLEMAKAGGLEYAALWRVLDGRAVRAVSLEFLTTAWAAWPEVAQAMQEQIAQKERNGAEAGEH